VPTAEPVVHQRVDDHAIQLPEIELVAQADASLGDAGRLFPLSQEHSDIGQRAPG
jgi:hypothetical protein